MALSTLVHEENWERRLVAELFFEQEHAALSIGYRHGWWRSAFVVGRALLSGDPAWPKAEGCIQSNTCVGIAFFENERRALSIAKSVIPMDRLMLLDLRALPLIRRELGTLGSLAEIWHFCALVRRFKGAMYLRRSSIPLLGWLLFRTYASMLANKTGVTIVTTNMVHPTSIGIVWATIRARQRAIFFEHATTPTLIMKDRGYSDLFVNFNHTRQLLVARGFNGERIHVLTAERSTAPKFADVAVRRVAVCINSYDSLESITDITEVMRHHGMRIVFRIHDADPRAGQLCKLAARADITTSLASESRIGAFLTSVDLVLCGNSNVIADSIKAGKPVIYYWSGTPEMFDYFGFVEYYQLDNARSREDLESLLLRRLGRTEC